MESLFSEASHTLVNGQYEDAATLFEELVTMDSQNPIFRHNYALSLECCKKFEEASKEYSTVIGEHAEFVPSYLGMANCYFYSGDAEHAEGMLRAARELDPQDPRAAILLAEILLLRGREAEAITEQAAAVTLIDESDATSTDNHALCYGYFGYGGPVYYSFWDRSLLQRDAFPRLSLEKTVCAPPVMVLLAHGGNASDIARRVSSLDRSHVFLVTLDDISGRILAEFSPDAQWTHLKYEHHELPALVLHVGRSLTQRGIAVVLPSDDGEPDSDKRAWATQQLESGLAFAVDTKGTVVANTPTYLDPRRVPPLLQKGQHPAPDVFAKIFA